MGADDPCGRTAKPNHTSVKYAIRFPPSVSYLDPRPVAIKCKGRQCTGPPPWDARRRPVCPSLRLMTGHEVKLHPSQNQYSVGGVPRGRSASGSAAPLRTRLNNVGSFGIRRVASQSDGPLLGDVCRRLWRRWSWWRTFGVRGGSVPRGGSGVYSWFVARSCMAVAEALG
jgi:hypothetical protein